MPPRRGRSAGRGGSSPCARARGGGRRRRRARRRRELLHGARGGRPGLRRRRGRSCPARPAEPVEPRLQERLDRRWHDDLASPPSSLTIASISSMKSGLPSAACRILARTSSASLRSAREPRDQQLAVLGGERLEQDRGRVELAAAPAGPQLEQLGRATQRRKIGASRDQSETCSIRSRKTGSAHWMSSRTRICGRFAARASISLRKESCVSAGEVPITRRARRRSRAGSRRAASR